MIVLLIILFTFIPLRADTSTYRLEEKLRTANGSVKVDILNELTYIEHRISFEKSLSYARQALQLSREIGYKNGEASSLQNLGFCYYLSNNMSDATKCFKNSLELANSLNNNKLVSSGLNYLGLVSWKGNEFPKAFENFRRALTISKSIGYKLEMSKSFNYMGLIYWQWSDYLNSLNYFLKSLELKEKLNDKFEIVVTLNNIANIYNEMGKYDLSVIYSLRALAIADTIKANYGLGRAYNNLGESYYNKKEYIKAEDAQIRSLRIRQSAGDKSGTGYSYISLGKIYFDLGNYGKSLDYFKKAFLIKKELNDNAGIAAVYLNMAKIYIKTQQFDNAEKSLWSSLEIAKQGNYKKVLISCYLAMSEFKEKTDDVASALKYYKLYSSVKDSVFAKDNMQKVAELQASYESANKEKEIEVLTKAKKIQALELAEQKSSIKILFAIIFSVIIITVTIAYRYSLIKKTKNILEDKNKVINKHQIDLIEANTSKDKFFSIIAHDLKSPFTGLLGYSDMLKNDFDSMSKDEIRPIVGNIYTITRGILNHIESLLTWSRTQIGNMDFNPESFDLYKESENIIGLIKANAINKGIKITNKVDAGIFIYADINMFRSILQNLVANGIKFTNRGGEILISADKTNKYIVISVEDNGIGMTEEIRNKLFRLDYRVTTPGTQSEKGTGLGLLLCKELVEINGGKIWIESKTGAGSKFIFTLKKA